MENTILTGDILDQGNIIVSNQECVNLTHINGSIPKLETLFTKGGCCNVVDGTSKEDDYLRKSKLLSEFITEVEKAIVRKNLGIADDFNLQWGNIKGYIENQKDLQKIIQSLLDEISLKIQKESEGDSAVEQIMYSNSQYPNIHNLKDALDTMLYKDLVINLQCSPSIAEYGQSIESITYTWSFNKNITEQTLDGIKLDINLRTYTIKGPFDSTTSKTLIVNDGVKEFSKSAVLNYYPGIYFGCSDKLTLEMSDIIKFNNKLLPSKNTTVTVNAEQQEYIYICIPYIYGEAIFKVGGFEGGFALIDDNFTFNKYSPIRYRIYKSDNKGLGNTTITIQ